MISKPIKKLIISTMIHHIIIIKKYIKVQKITCIILYQKLKKKKQVLIFISPFS